jgi:hypothetical protein
MRGLCELGDEPPSVVRDTCRASQPYCTCTTVPRNSAEGFTWENNNFVNKGPVNCSQSFTGVTYQNLQTVALLSLYLVKQTESIYSIMTFQGNWDPHIVQG